IARDAARTLLERSGVRQIDIALTLGSGWSDAVEHLGAPLASIPATDVPGFRPSPVAGHHGELSVFRTPAGQHLLVLGARTHLYEGHGVGAVVHGVRVAAAAGARTMVLTNGAGGLHPDLAPGTPILISDHINLTARSPLTGAEFVDLTDLYSPNLRDL